MAPNVGAMRKWPIAGDDGMTQEARRAYWESEHRDNDYAGVFTVSQDEVVVSRCVGVAERRGPHTVLVAGCGSNVRIQQALLDRVPAVECVVGVDFPGVVEVAAARLTDPRAQWVGTDIATHGCGAQADLVITINSVLSDSDEENRRLLTAFRDAVPEGGALAGLFASIHAPLEIGYLQPGQTLLDQVNLEECRFAERRQGITQIFYSPLRLRMVLAEAGFRLDHMEVVFLDSPELAQQARDYYGLGTDPDVMAWELFVEATAV